MQSSHSARALLVAVLAGGLCAIAVPAQAAAPASVSAAQQNLAQAARAAQQASSALGAAQQQLAGAQKQLAAVQARLATLDQAVSDDTAHLTALNQQVRDDKAELAVYVRAIYKSGGNTGALAYIIGAANLGDVFQRVAEMDRVNQAGTVLLDRIGAAQAAAHQALGDATAARQQAQVAQEQATTAEAVVAVETDQLTTAAVAANSNVGVARQQLSAAQAAAAAQARAAAAAAAAAAAHARSIAPVRVGGPAGIVYTPVPGPLFTVDTDLTKPSGETAATLDSFLSGTALAGLGASFMNAETTYHVSARYFVAHAILESAYGTSAIAQDKHNLFGYGANDANPYGDAMSFASFDACIQFVAKMVAQNYLSPTGAFYHGPTLRGMNVDYASDPLWASKIASIASTFPA